MRSLHTAFAAVLLPQNTEIVRRTREPNPEPRRPDPWGYRFGRGTEPLPAAELEALFAEIPKLRLQVWKALVGYPRFRKPLLALLAIEVSEEIRRASELCPSRPRRERLAVFLRDNDKYGAALAEAVARFERYVSGEHAFGDDVKLPRAGEKKIVELTVVVRAASERLNRLRGRIVAANIRLGIGFAKKYATPDFGFEDMINEVAIGLFRAVDRFEPERRWRFSTYATWWVRHACSRARSDRAEMVRLPAHVHQKLGTIAKARKELHTNDVGLIAEHVEMEEDDVNRLLKRVAMVRAPFSLNEPIAEDGSPLQDFVADDLPSAEDLMAGASEGVLVCDVLSRLDERDRDIIERRFGIGCEQETLAQIGNRFGLSRERIRQLETIALDKLLVLVSRQKGIAHRTRLGIRHTSPVREVLKRSKPSKRRSRPRSRPTQDESAAPSLQQELMEALKSGDGPHPIGALAKQVGIQKWKIRVACMEMVRDGKVIRVGQRYQLASPSVEEEKTG